MAAQPYEPTCLLAIVRSFSVRESIGWKEIRTEMSECSEETERAT